MDNVNELLNNTILKRKIDIENGVSDFLFEFTGGHPWWIQKICDDKFLNESDQVERYTLSNVQESAGKFKKELDLYNELMKAGKPFRKVDLWGR